MERRNSGLATTASPRRAESPNHRTFCVGVAGRAHSDTTAMVGRRQSKRGSFFVMEPRLQFQVTSLTVARCSIEAIWRKTLQDVNGDSGKKRALRLFPLEFWLHLWGNAKGVHENLA